MKSVLIAFLFVIASAHAQNIPGGTSDIQNEIPKTSDLDGVAGVEAIVPTGGEFLKYNSGYGIFMSGWTTNPERIVQTHVGLGIGYMPSALPSDSVFSGAAILTVAVGVALDSKNFLLSSDIVWLRKIRVLDSPSDIIGFSASALVKLKPVALGVRWGGFIGGGVGVGLQLGYLIPAK